MKTKYIIISIAMAVVLVVGYFYFHKPAKKGAVSTVKEVSAGVPQIATNPGAKVPEVNPLDRANPFKYTNPLR